MSKKDRWRSDRLYSDLHTAGNALTEARDKTSKLRGLLTLLQTAGRIINFSKVDTNVKHELIKQKLRFETPLTAEERKFALKKGYIKR